MDPIAISAIKLSNRMIRKALGEGIIKAHANAVGKQIYLVTDGESKVDWLRMTSLVKALNESNTALFILCVISFLCVLEELMHLHFAVGSTLTMRNTTRRGSRLSK